MNIILKIMKRIKLNFTKLKLYIFKDVIFEKKTFINSCFFEGHNKIYYNVNLSEVYVGFGTYVSTGTKLVKTKIGRFCSIGSDVKTIIGKHPTQKFVSTHPSFYSTLDQAGFSFVDKNLFSEIDYIDEDNTSIIIGNDVWIGSNSKILEGVKIGNGAIIATGAVVTKDVEPYSIVGGVPAKKIRYRFNEKTRKFLLEFKWWNKDYQWIKNNKNLFADVKLFQNKFS